MTATQGSNTVIVVMDDDVLAKISLRSYSVNKILVIESTLLGVLDWTLYGPTALGIASHTIAPLARQHHNGL